MSGEVVARAVARRRDGYRHEVEVDGHTVVIDEPEDSGGVDAGPSPTRLVAASLAACTAITMEMYADRKGWDLGSLEVEAVRLATERDEPAKFEVILRLPDGLPEENIERLVTIAGKCPVHRMLTGDVQITDRVEAAAA
jgi:putative redox protein